MNRKSLSAPTTDNFYYTVILHGVIKKPAIIILAACILTLLLGMHIPNLSFKTSVYDMVVANLPETIAYEKFKEEFGSDEIIRIVIRTDNIFSPDNFKEIDKISRAAEQIRGVRRIISLPAIKKNIELSSEWPIEKFEAVIEPVALFKKNLISNDRQTSSITLVLEKNADREQVIRDVEQLIKNAPGNFRIYQIGMPLVSQSMADFTEKDFMRLPPITLLLVTVMLWFLFRSIIGIVMPLMAVIMSLIWTLGFMGWLKVDLSMMTMVVPVFLIAVGTAYSLHIMSCYSKCIQQIIRPDQAVLETYRQLTLPSIIAVVTTIIGLGSLLANRIHAIREFALFSSFGMVSLLLVLLTVFPAGLMLFPKQPLGADFQMNGHDWLKRFLHLIVELNLKHRKSIFISISAVVVFCIIGMFFLQVETNPIGFFKSNTPISRHFHDIYKDLSGSFPLYVVMEGNEDDFFEDPAHISLIEKLGNYLEDLPGIDKSLSFADYMKLVNYSTNQYNPEYYKIPEEGFEVRMVINSYKTMLGDDMLTRFMSPAFSKTNIMLFTHLSSSRDFLMTRERILTYTHEHFPQSLKWDVTGFGVAVAASSHLLTRGQTKSILITMMLIFIIMLMLFLSAKVGFIAILPNAFPIIINFGVMGWLGIHLSMVTSLIASIAIGLAVDDTIHYQYRYSREFKKDLDKDRSMRDAILHVGRPILFTTITICLGFSVLLFSSFRPTSIFGLLLVITMLAALVGDLIILPALMLNVELVTAWDLFKLMPASSGISAITAHELNQPLNAIKMGSEYLQMMIQQGTRIQSEHLAQVVDEIGTQVDRASGIVNRLALFHQSTSPDREMADVNESVRNAITLADHQLKMEDIQLDIDLNDNLPFTYAYPHKVAEVVFNLLVNACDAIAARKGIDPGGSFESRVTVRTFLNKGQIAVMVADTGIGIPAHLVHRIMEPFFTTKLPGKGKGLGLCTSKEIVKDLGGRIKVMSEENRGTQITVTFPVRAWKE